MKRILTALIFSMALVSCGKQELSPTAYIKWINDEANGLRKQKTFDNISVEVQYRPADYQVIMETQNPNLHSNELTRKRKEYGGMQYYLVRFSTADKLKDIMRYDINSEQEYYERLNYSSFGMQEDIKLVQNGDTLGCALFNSVRSYGISPAADFLIGFEDHSETSTKDRQLIIHDRLFGLGTMKFIFTGNNLENIPTIRTN